MLTRVVAVTLLFQISVAPGAATESPLTSNPKPQSGRSRFVHRIFGKNAMVRVGASTVWGHMWNRPREWGRGIEGFGKRAASAMGGHLIGASVGYTVSTLRHEQFGYQRSDRQGFKPRLTHALLATVITKKTTTGKDTVAMGRISGVLSSGLGSRLWQPARVSNISSGLTSAGATFSIDAGLNVVREFWPEIRH